MISAPTVLRWKLLDYTPNDWAKEHVHGRDERFLACVTCRQVGKTYTVAMEIDSGMEQPPDRFGPPHVGLISYDYKRAELAVDRYVGMVQRAFGTEYIRINSNKHEAVIPSSGAKLTWMSADDPDAGIGFTFSKLGIDEGQRVPDTVIEKLWPALDVRRAQVRAFGTPDIRPDQTWFRGMWLAGKDPDDTDTYSYTVTWRENPWVSVESVNRARQILSRREFLMLYEGQWVDEGGSFFTNVENALYVQPPAYNPQRNYVIAVDLAIREDFTVVMIGDTALRRAVHMERWHKTDPITTYDRIKRIVDAWGNPRVYYDGWGIGLAMGPELRERGIRATPVEIKSNAKKMELLLNLQRNIEHGRIMFPKWDALMREFEGFLLKERGSGIITAEAAAGYHDDCVIALAILNFAMRNTTTRGDIGGYDYAEKPDRLFDRLAAARTTWR